MAACCDQTFVRLMTEISKLRALGDQESIDLERAIRRLDLRNGRQTVPWTPEATRRLCDSIVRHKPVETIAFDMNRTPAAIRRKIWKLGGINRIVGNGSGDDGGREA